MSSQIRLHDYVPFAPIYPDDGLEFPYNGAARVHISKAGGTTAVAVTRPMTMEMTTNTNCGDASTGQPVFGLTLAAVVTSHPAYVVDEEGWELYDPAALVDVPIEHDDEQQQQPVPSLPAPVPVPPPVSGPPFSAPVNPGRGRFRRSPTPQPDPRLALWRQERRRFAGNVTIETHHPAVKRAKAAVHRPLQTPDGVPQLSFFVDGSMGDRQFVSPAVQSPEGERYQQQDVEHPAGESGGVRAKDFTIGSWSSEKVFSPDMAEMAALAQAMCMSVNFLDSPDPSKKPTVANLEIFSDSRECLGFLQATKAHRAPKELRPIVKAIVWMSHYLKERGSSVQLFWNKRCCALGPGLADAAAGAWRDNRGHIYYSQGHVDLPQGLACTHTTTTPSTSALTTTSPTAAFTTTKSSTAAAMSAVASPSS
ncbi:hypothetical protein B0H65DRAFT_553365 [Neurospora tetraspora]|uniref:Uncharacterized protein n=1 Tax=Neurospora tetraspora TaxID=94610 RepID=A0AAE0J163_9PEZI|nr:hypothetical protein B0H65DRAFT_553365 [Neurospora tetraspora]